MIKVQMNKLKIDQNIHDSEIPKQCPICGDKNTPTYLDHTFIKMENANNPADYLVDYYGLYRFKCMNCDEIFLCVILFSVDKISKKWNGKILQTVPYYTPVSIPEFIKEISPRANDFYQAAALCESNEFIELAATGYRSCLEILIKDFLINQLHDTDPKLPKMKLVNAIKKLDNKPLLNSANAVRFIANNLTHYENTLNSNDFIELKTYLEIVLHFIGISYKGLNVNPKYQD